MSKVLFSSKPLNSLLTVLSPVSNPCLNAAAGEKEEVLESLSDVNGVGESFILLMVGVVILYDLVIVGVIMIEGEVVES